MTAGARHGGEHAEGCVRNDSEQPTRSSVEGVAPPQPIIIRYSGSAAAVVGTGRERADAGEVSPDVIVIDSGDATCGIDFRQSADKEIVKFLRQYGQKSKIARDLTLEFQDLGVGALLKLHKDKMLFRRLRKLHIFVPLPPPSTFYEAVGSLAYLSSYGAVPLFIRDYVFGDFWNPELSSLRTCLVNACLCQFGREYRLFCSQEGYSGRVDVTRTGSDEDLEPDLRRPYAPQSAPGPAERTLSRDSIEYLLSVKISPEDKIALIREAQGFTQKEIAKELGLTEAAVNSRLRRSKKKIADSKREDG